ncbi:MAG: hypothetical protein MJ016_02175 [Victivallaceae bacterium]|nr:hypothetical protein [Victivallaceae bacterium]
MQRYVKNVDETTGLCGEVAGPDGDPAYFEGHGFELRDVEEAYNGLWYLVGKVPPPPASVIIAKYDKAMEAHLFAERAARGYTTREPSDYKGSSVPRWASDAEDWIAHRDQVMLYGLEVENHYKETGEGPTIEEFKAGLPKIHWSVEITDNNGQ